jgi:thiol-disulfide isomerase/thioredoxin
VSITPGPSGDAAFMIGEPAPPLVVEQLDSETDISLASLRGKPVWVNFMATWCPPCRDELPRMVDFATRYEDEGLVVISVDVEEDPDVVGPYMTSVGVTFPVGLDRDGSAQDEWGAFALPVHYWIDASGVIRDGALGGIGPDVMAAGLESILPDVDVEP